ncbi:MAG TPA: carbohydrate ABC transporter permease [Solirubrobacteraceae bacterium]|jgi:ABC-type glycerol-3-phosphate transport system permease component|nr:carbohydrate ABC transporter permease [Solirubrobacteraceae bacterium]
MRRAAVALFCLVALAPFLYVLSTSLKQTRVLFDYPPDWIPNDPYGGNYTKLLTDYPFVRWVFNTLLVAGVVTAVKLCIDSMAAYALTRMRFAGRRVVLGAMVATIMIPPALLIIPLFFIVRDAGLLDTYWALILPALANPVGVLILRAFIQAVPEELEHAARVDNANAWQVYRHVILPAIRPGLVVVASYVFLVQYVDFVWPLVATQSDSKLLVSTGLATLKPRTINVDWGLTSAGCVLSMVPITVVFLVFQRQLVGRSLVAGLKG